MKLIHTLFASALCAMPLLTACDSSHSDEPSTTATYIRFGMGRNAVTLDWEAESRPKSRASMPAIPAPVAEKPATIGVWGFNSRSATPVFSNRRMVYLYGPDYASSGIPPFPVDNEYPYENPEIWIGSTSANPTRYKFYAYAPYIATPDPDMADVTVYNESFSDFSAFIWRRLPRFTGTDYLLNQNMLNYTSKRPGDPNPVQWLLMEHLYSRLRLCFVLGPRFGDLREIHVKSVTLTGLSGDKVILLALFSPADPAVDASGNLAYTCTHRWEDEPGDPQPPISLTLDRDAELTELDYYKDAAYPVLDADGNLLLSATNREHYGYLPFCSLYTYPNAPLQSINITVVYDIYDKDGLLLRRDDTASNTVTLDFDPMGTTGGTKRVLEPGRYYDIKLEIEPKYLYVLSDNDVEPDGKIIIP